MSMFKRLFSSSPSRPPPPDPTPKWKDEVTKIESNSSQLKSAFPSVPLSTIAATGASPTTSSSPEQKGSASSSEQQQQFDAVPKLLFMIENDSGEGFARRVKPLAHAVCKQYDEVKKLITEDIAVKIDENAKNLREQMEQIAVAFSDAHELKFTKEELQMANKKNEGLQNEIDTARQTVMELMGKIAKLNPKAAKELKEKQQQESSPSPTRPQQQQTPAEISEEIKNMNEEQLRQKLADMLEECKRVDTSFARTSSDVQKWKDLVEEERKTLESLRNSHLQTEQQIRSRYEEEISNLKKQHADALTEKDKNWEIRVAEVMRKALCQKEETIRTRMENEEMEERSMYLVPQHIRAHVSDAKFRLQVAENAEKKAVDQKEELDVKVRELEKEKERLTNELAENTRAMMLLQAGSAEPSPLKSPNASRSKFSL